MRDTDGETTNPVGLTRHSTLGASTRAIIALVLTILSTTDPEHLGFTLEFDDLLFAGYLTFATATALVSFRNWTLDFLLSPWCLAVDCIVFALVPHSNLPHSVDTLLALPVLAFSILIFANMRFGPRVSERIGILLFTACLANCGLMISMEPASPQDLLRQVVVLFLAIFGAHWAVRNFGIRAAIGLRAPKRPLDQELVRSVLSKVGNIYEAPFSLAQILQTNKAEGLSMTVFCGGLTQAQPAQGLPNRLIEALTPGHSWTFGRHGNFLIGAAPGSVPHRGSPIPALRDFADAHGLREGWIARLPTEFGDMVVLLGNPGRISWSDQYWFAASVREIRDVFETAWLHTVAAQAERDGDRMRLALELHDNVAQTVAGTRFWLSRILGLDLPAEARSDITNLRDELGNELANLRGVIASLRGIPQPDRAQATQDDTLTALRHCAASLTEKWGIAVDLACSGRCSSIPRNSVQDILELVGEAVSNAVRHGQASHITLACKTISRGVLVTVRDNGTGFGVPNPPLPWSIRARCLALGAQCHISSRPGETVVNVEVPTPDSALEN